MIGARPRAAVPVWLGLLAVAFALGLTGCGGGTGPGTSVDRGEVTGVPGGALGTVPPSAALRTAAPLTGDDAFCDAVTRSARTVRDLVVPAVVDGPKPPAALALLLVGPRDRVAAATPTDPDLTPVRTELLGALDDIAVQGQAGQPAGGDGRSPVAFDTTRLVAAVDAADRGCAAR